VIQALEDLKNRLIRCRDSVLKRKSKQIYQEQDKRAVIDLVKFYFSEVQLKSSDLSRMSVLDNAMQELLGLAQKNSLKSKYRNSFKGLIAEIDDVYKSIICAQPSKTVPQNTQSQLIIQTLKMINNSAALSYEQALLDLESSDRKSWRGTVIEFRESMRIALDKLASDAEVTSQQGFKLEPDTKGPTMRQKAVFIFKSRKLPKNETKLVGDAINSIEEFSAKFIRSTYTRASIVGHADQDVTKDDAIKVGKYVELALSELLALKG
jgi:hypothetical protein